METATKSAGPYYVVERDPSHRFILAEFGRRLDAEEFTGNVGGRIVTLADAEEDMAELVTAWREGDFSRQANKEAVEILIQFRKDLENVTSSAEPLAERYASTDPLCAAVLRVHDLITEAKDVIDEIVSDETVKRRLRAPWAEDVESFERWRAESEEDDAVK